MALHRSLVWLAKHYASDILVKQHYNDIYFCASKGVIRCIAPLYSQGFYKFSPEIFKVNDWASFITFTARRLWNSIPNALENQSRFDSPAFHTANTMSQVFPQLNQQRAQIWNGLCVTQTHTMAMHKIPHDTCRCRPAPSVLCPSQPWKLMSGGTGMKTGTERVISPLICKKIEFCSCLLTTLLCISVLTKEGPSVVFILCHQGAMFPFYPHAWIRAYVEQAGFTGDVFKTKAPPLCKSKPMPVAFKISAC